MSCVVKTVKDHVATKTLPQRTVNIKFKAQTQPVLLFEKRAVLSEFFMVEPQTSNHYCHSKDESSYRHNKKKFRRVGLSQN
jgi:hypothetical protein